MISFHRASQRLTFLIYFTVAQYGNMQKNKQIKTP